jgi:hypothetical protein
MLAVKFPIGDQFAQEGCREYSLKPSVIKPTMGINASRNKA